MLVSLLVDDEPVGFSTADKIVRGCSYVKTHMTVPGPLKYHQAVTRWVLQR